MEIEEKMEALEMEDYKILRIENNDSDQNFRKKALEESENNVPAPRKIKKTYQNHKQGQQCNNE